ncbi:uncharacterized protein DDB_G0284459 isoform X2 [Bicyclus anynana]|uniref:Uncharacterized protein DDB_G0284459 isoform X2 n=1 Tax=Bicyclus anynana TaxID=110368 RepID=A0A6J1NDK2_BICAN|nr:uncharacterized protein DDB_G0284459 isoform X2 [Bicyclus anynana]
MSAPSDSAASPSPCACTNISLMQLFHELKQKFPGVPDHVVSNTIELYCHDKRACETHLHSEIKASLTHAYHASSSAAARQLSKLRDNLPLKCRNQPLVKYEVAKTTAVESTCQAPQQAVISNTEPDHELPKLKLNTDANQNVVESKTNEINNPLSPVTIINIDNCFAKYHAESPSDLELTNENNTLEIKTLTEDPKECKQPEPIKYGEQPESTNYKILKSNKVKANLNEKLIKKEVKEKKTIKKDSPQLNSPQEKALPEKSLQEKAPLETASQERPPQEKVLQEKALQEKAPQEKAPQEKAPPEKAPPEKVPQEKPQRPNTLNFIKPIPDIAFKENLKQPDTENCRTVSPAPSVHKPESKEKKPDPSPYRPGYPLNLSVNVNCHMDISHGYGLEDYDSPRAITSVNLTVCTPTSNMASPVRDTRDEDGGFEGHVTVTVSPSTAPPPYVRRRAPAPPPTRIESPRPSRPAPAPPGQPNDHNLIERQKERLARLASALAQEKGCLSQLNRETQILAASPPTPSAAQRLRDYVERLRDECDTLAKRLEMRGSEPDDMGNFYSNIYTGQRPTASWQCHMCTFRNHPLLDKCEECDMPRIFVGTSPAMTHDSGFGSFRDRNRRGVMQSTDVTDAPISSIVSDCRAVNA